MTTALTLFDVAALTLDRAPDKPKLCRRCQQNPPTSRVFAARNLIGICPAAYLFDTWFRDVAYRVDSGPCCDTCAWYLASAWWNPTRSCPRGGCTLWAHTLDQPQPGHDCPRCHYERAIVWITPLEAAA